MHHLLALTFLFFSSLIRAELVYHDLVDKEIELAISLSDKYEAKLQTKGPCTKIQFSIIAVRKGYSPERWMISANDVVSYLENNEVSGIIDLVGRLEIPLIKIDPITGEMAFLIQGSSCGFTPYKWQAVFDNQN